jgi:hypothetical protein
MKSSILENMRKNFEVINDLSHVVATMLRGEELPGMSQFYEDQAEKEALEILSRLSKK